MPLSKETRQKISEMTFGLDLEIANRVKVIAQVLNVSRNELICQAVTESVRTYEDDPEYQKKRQGWIESLAEVGHKGSVATM